MTQATDDDDTPPGRHTWTDDDDRLARLRHRQALAAWPTSTAMPTAVMTNYPKETHR